MKQTINKKELFDKLLIQREELARNKEWKSKFCKESDMETYAKGQAQGQWYVYSEWEKWLTEFLQELDD